MSLRGKVDIAGVTHPGQVRDHNEDQIVTDADLGLVMVADGMGGSKAGEVASGMAAELISSAVGEALTALRSGGTPPADPTDPTDPADPAADTTGPVPGADGHSDEAVAIARAIGKANGIIHQVANTQPQCAGMGTTVVLVLFHDNRLTVAHVGDSRLYRLRGGALEQVTADHSLVQELVDRGFYTEDEARQSNNKNIVTRALGISPEVEYSIAEEPAEPGDLYLLCSDGLNDMIDDAAILAALEETGAGAGGDLQAAAQVLVDRANDAGGRDNVSVVLARVIKPFPQRNSLFGRLISWFD